MNLTELTDRVDTIIRIGVAESDDEVAHSEEDRLLQELVRQFCPDWVIAEVDRLIKANFARWCA